ncbi:MAG TPA: hypothetical protein VI911_08350 [Patescibacteria group bacterium]|nr:hypothetical protein [Patescibacteria group bacterium]
MLTLTYDAAGARVPDEKAEAWARKQIDVYKKKPVGTNITLKIANGVVINAFRVLIKEGFIDNNDIQVNHDGFIYPIDPFGHILDWPPGFAEVEDNFLERLLF